LMQQLLPANAPIAVLVNPENPNSDLDVTELQKAARTLGQSITFVRATREPEIDAVFATLGERRAFALLVNTDPFFLARRDQLVSLAAGKGMPAIYAHRRGWWPDQLWCEPCRRLSPSRYFRRPNSQG